MSFCNWAITIDGLTHPFGEVEVAGWDFGGRDYRTDDTDRPRADGRWFGKDFANPGDIEIELLIRAEGADRQEKFTNAMNIRDEFTKVWNGDDVRFINGKVAELHIADRAVVEGRPRHVDWDDSMSTHGIIKGTALFVRNFDEAMEPGASWFEVDVGLVPVQQGGLIAPLVAPLTTARASTRARPFTVGGDSPTWPIISVKGPLQSGGKVELTGVWSLHLNRGLKYDEVAVFDTRPGVRSMKLNGKSMNLLSPTGARLTQLSMAPGIQEVALRGTSVEGTASVNVKWREVKKVI